MTPHLHPAPDSPPDDVLDEIALAGAVYDRMREHGRRLHFALHPRTGRLEIQLLDDAGRTVDIVSPSRVLKIASGAEIA